MSTMARTTGTMLYDADCGFCTRTAALVPRLRMRANVDAIQASELIFDRERAARELPFVHDDGHVDYGHHAIAATLRTGSVPLRLLAVLIVWPGLERLAAAVYHWVSAHRHQLPGGTAACSLNEPPAG